MKQIITSFIIAALSINAQAQTASPAPAHDNDQLNTTVARRHALGAVTITGISLAAASHVVGIVGVATLISESQKSYYPDGRGGRKAAPAILGAGAVMFVAGVTMSIVGGIHDYKKARRNYVSLAAPKTNEVGIAWNF